MSADMKGKVVVITGATSGIGQVTAETLAAMGARIVQIARSRERGEAAMARLRARAPGAAHSIYYADLSLLSEMKRAAGEIAAAEPRVDVLINNAGAMFGPRVVTADGLEKTFALNHMAYFVVTEVLRERLLAAAPFWAVTVGGGDVKRVALRGSPARVVNVSSNAHTRAQLDLDDLQSSREYGGFQAYSRSKLCNILFARELARRLAGTGVTANALHPGYVATRWGDEAGGLVGLGNRIGKSLFAISPEEGAKTMIYLASSPEVAAVSGAYFYQCKQAEPSAAAQDDTAARRLWEESARLAGLADAAYA